MQCEPCEPTEEAGAEAEAEPAARAKVRGAKAVPPSWGTTPSVLWPQRGQPKHKGVRYHEDKDGKRTYWLFNGRQRYIVCVCQDEGLCGLIAQSKTRPGYAKGCALREDRKAAYKAAKEANEADRTVLPNFKGRKAHKGYSHFVLHRGRESVTMPSSGEARPLCKCGDCFLVCISFQHEYAVGCVHNPAPPCARTGCPAAATVQGYCCNCATRTGAVANRKAERDHELQALMAQHGIARAPDDPNDPSVKPNTPYGQQNPQADYAARVVIKTGGGKRGFQWKSGCMGALEPGKAPGPCAYGGLVSTKLYDFHCVRCFIASYPNDVRAVNAKKFLKAKELAVREYLEATFPDYRWSFDRAFAVGVKQRPDALTRTRDRILIVEIDENSHIIEACGKEREREAIFQRRNKTAEIVMIRFNPDAYVDLVTGKKVPSCFYTSPKENLVTVHPKQKKAWEARLATLANAIRMCIDPTHPDYLEVLPPKEEGRAFFSFELYYDNINGMTEAQQEAKRSGRTDAYKRAAQKRKAEAEAAAESDSD